MLSRIRTEVSGASTGIPPGFDRYNEMAVGMLQMAVDTFAGSQGVFLGDARITHQPGDARYSTHLAKKYTLAEDRDEIIQDIVSALNTKVISILPRSNIEHRFAYRLLPTCNVLIGLDPREFDHEQDGIDTSGEIAGDF